MAPHTSGAMANTHCAEWYIGPHTSCTRDGASSTGTPSVGAMAWAMRVSISGGPPVAVSVERTPLGQPVVPDV